jgi:hypothetical protein
VVSLTSANPPVPTARTANASIPAGTEGRIAGIIADQRDRSLAALRDYDFALQIIAQPGAIGGAPGRVADQQQLLLDKPRPVAAPDSYYGATAKDAIGHPLTVTEMRHPTEAQRALAKSMASSPDAYGNPPEPVAVPVPEAEETVLDEEIAAFWDSQTEEGF